MGESEIVDLANNGFEREGLYTLLKAAAKTPLQLQLLQGIINTAATRSDIKLFRTFIKEHVTELPADATADAMKLAQYSRQGFELWHEKFKASAEKAAARDNPTYIVGHSMFMGIIDFIESHAETQKELNVLLPHLIDDLLSEDCGYSIKNGQVQSLSKDFQRQPESVIIDDVRNTGETENGLRDFWNSRNTADSNPIFEYVSQN